MKFRFCFLLVLVLSGCENNFEDIYRYSKIISQSKDYPVYLDMSEIGNIQVTGSGQEGVPFKIVSNDDFYFVGEMLKGISVYEKSGSAADFLCFIECGYIKDFDLVGDHLFCNNLIDMIVLDVGNPPQINVLHRQENHFNRFTSYKENWNLPYTEGKGLVVSYENHGLTGTVTEKNPNLDFTEYDNLYGNLTTKELPEDWFSENPEYDKPYVGIIQIGTDEIHTYGSYNSWFISSFLSGTFSEREEGIWTTPRGNYTPPYYYSNAWPVRMFYSDSLIYIFGIDNANGGYTDCIPYNEISHQKYHLYFPTFKPLDITYMPDLREFLVLSGQSVWGAFKYSEDQASAYMERYIDYNKATDATSILRVGSNVITIGSELTVYLPTEDELNLVKNYPGISGNCCLKEENVLAVANTGGLFFYDINDLEDIKLIP